MVNLLGGAMEVLVLGMVCYSPWVYGAVHAGFEFILDLAVALLLVLWGARMLLEGKLTWKNCPVALCLASLFLLGVWQLTPLPASWLDRVSPATARLYEHLLPAEPETLPLGESRIATVPPPGSTISFYPAGTRVQVLRLLGVFLLFAVVRNTIASPASLRRLAGVAVANGAILSLFALIQFFTSPPNTLYWTYPCSGSLFGPFICRNHFPFYINMCIGLGIGLLPAERHSRQDPSDFEPPRTGLARWVRLLGEMVQQPQTLWVCAALAMMLTGVLFCLSRGGLLALVGSAAVFLLLPRASSSRSGGLRVVALALLGALFLVLWFGFERVEARWLPLWQGKDVGADRLPLWSRTLPLVKDFPVWGTGYGTFDYVEPWSRGPQEPPGDYEHAHNDYLEAMIEGGVLRFLISLAAVILVFRYGYRALRHSRDPQIRWLALGALFAFSAVAIHSFVDFGLHIPAIAVLATVLSAHLCGLGERAGRAEQPGEDSPQPQASLQRHVLSLSGIAPLFGALTLAILAIILCQAGWKAEKVDRYKQAAIWNEIHEPAFPERKLPDLQGAVLLDPGNAHAHLDLALAHLELYDQQGDSVLENAKEAPFRTHLLPALRHFLAARDLCPLIGETHLRIAALVGHLTRADQQGQYLQRAKLLNPVDSDLWYLCGLQELASGQPDRAWESWHRSLELSDGHLKDILGHSSGILTPSEISSKVIPDDPVLLVAAAGLVPNPTRANGDPFLIKALELLEREPSQLAPDRLHLRGVVRKSLGHPEGAIADLRNALEREPLHGDWRLDLAQLLYETGRLKESRIELLTLLIQQPDNRPAHELLNTIVHEMAQKT